MGSLSPVINSTTIGLSSLVAVAAVAVSRQQAFAYFSVGDEDFDFENSVYKVQDDDGTEWDATPEEREMIIQEALDNPNNLKLVGDQEFLIEGNPTIEVKKLTKLEAKPTKQELIDSFGDIELKKKYDEIKAQVQNR